MTREERVMLAAFSGFSDVVVVEGAAVLLVPEAPGSPMLNRAVGLGVDEPATEAQVDAALAAMPSGTRFYVSVTPEAQPPELQGWLAARGLEPGWGWMVFRRGMEVPAAADTELELHLVEDAQQRAAFARIVRLGYDLPEEVEPRFAELPDLGWDCLLALDRGEPAGTAAQFTAEGVSYLGFAATLPGHRGKGAQSALLAERIGRAVTDRCDVILTETGERRADLPSNSYRNIVRAGFEEVGVTANWVGVAA